MTIATRSPLVSPESRFISLATIPSGCESNAQTAK
jgi:hypothetical protein